MNQILETKQFVYLKEKHHNTNSKKIYLFIFIVSVLIGCIIILYLIFYSLTILYQTKITNAIKEKYNVATLYGNTNSYSALKLSNSIEIIGLIEIPGIQISYPILSESSEELLKISVCRFSGPLPNRSGNMCIAGHNYRNNLMFGNLNKLKIQDSIFITDLNNNKLEYIIYDKKIVKQNDLNSIVQTADTQITLVTCKDNNNQERIILKAKVKE